MGLRTLNRRSCMRNFRSKPATPLRQHTLRTQTRDFGHTPKQIQCRVRYARRRARQTGKVHGLVAFLVRGVFCKGCERVLEELQCGDVVVVAAAVEGDGTASAEAGCGEGNGACVAHALLCCMLV
jgi:hypothetical protein